jgi:hypothetical protein
MPTYGYARVSTIDQDLSLQRRTLKAAGRDVIHAEEASGTRRSGRTELQVLLDFLQPGDILVVTRVDRLARSIRDLQDIVHELRERGVAACPEKAKIPGNPERGHGGSIRNGLVLFGMSVVSGLSGRKCRGMVSHPPHSLTFLSETATPTGAG